MRYLIVYGDKNKSFNNKLDLLNFIKNKFDNCLNKSSVKNYFYSDKNIVEIVFGRYDNSILIGIGGDNVEDKKELTKYLYYDIRICLGCYSKVI